MTVIVAIVGLGLMGTSLGLALKAASSEITIIGHDPETAHIARAKKLGAIDKSHWNLISACEQANCVFLDLGLEAIESTLRALKNNLKERTVIIDLAPVKRPVMVWAEDMLSEAVQFVGGHIVRSRQSLGQTEPSAELLRGATFYLVAPEGIAPWAIEMASNLALAVGAKPLYIDAAEHDGIVAATLGLPLLGALALVETIKTRAGWQERAQSFGEEFAAYANLLLNAPEAATDLLLANADNLLYWLDAYAKKVTELCQAISAQNQQTLRDMFAEAQKTCIEWLATGDKPRSELPAEDMKASFQAMFLGSFGRKRPR